MNPRDTADNMQRRQMIRRGGTYGSLLPEDAPDDGAERGIAAFIGCASLIRQFEFAMNVWADKLLADEEILAGVHLRFSDIYKEIEHSENPSEALEHLVGELPCKKPN